MTADSGQADGYVQVIPANEYRRERWRNQLGWTREIARGRLTPEGFALDGDDAAADWDWRLSIAEIERDAAFSAFPGIDRELVLLSGHGVRLRFDDGEVHELHPPHERLRFAGERGLTGELLDGPTHDFNLMWRRERINAELWHRPLVGPMVIFTEPRGLWAVHLLAGRAALDGSHDLPPLSRGDTVLIRAGEARLRHVLHGGGEALMIRLSPREGA
ncbi:HutD/Ves family protein [Lysobacter olei]